MKIQCEECDNEWESWDDYNTSEESGHALMEFLDEKDLPQQATKNSKKKKIIKKPKAKLPDSYIESIYLTGVPYFLQVIDGQIKPIERIETVTEIIEPLTLSNTAYEPYRFNNVQDLPKVNLEELLDETKLQIDKYLILPERDKMILLGNIAISYNLEWVDSLHYVAFIGDTGSGKTSALKLASDLMFKPLYAGDISFANTFRFLGKEEEGYGTILEDEIQTINKDFEKISSYKVGYVKGAKIPKINMNEKDQVQSYWRTFGPKILAGEELPKDRGLVERIVSIYMIQGKPKYDISRASGTQKAELQNIRNKWLLWKLQNLNRPNRKHDLTISGRNAQLFEDYLILFSGTKFYEPLKNAVTYYIKEREESIHDKLEAKVFRTVRKVMKNNQASISLIWEQIMKDIPGQKFTEYTYHIDDGEEITKHSVSKMIVEKFRAKKGRNSKERYFTFQPDVIINLDEKYGKEFLN